MKVAAITGPRDSALLDRPMPRIGADFCLVRNRVIPMCTEYKGWEAGAACDCLGHESAGEVVDAGRSTRVRTGDRVVVMPQSPCGACDLCRTGDYIHCEHTVDPLAVCGSETGRAAYAEYTIQKDWLLLPIPDGMSYAHASMACCGLGPAFGAMQRLRVDAFDTVLIMGLGPVGLGGVINGVYRGARVVGADPNPHRRQLARDLGADLVLDPTDPEALLQAVRALTGGRGADKAVECTAAPPAQALAIAAVRRRGQVAFVGWGGRIEIGNMVPDGKTLQGCWHWNLHDAPLMMRMIAACPQQLDRLITHRLPLAEVQRGWEIQSSGRCGKIVLEVA